MATINGQDEYRISGSTECGGEATCPTIKPGERFIARELSHGERVLGGVSQVGNQRQHPS